MADNDFIAPDLYSSENIQKFVNSNFSKSALANDREIAENYWQTELGINDDFFSPGYSAFKAAVEGLPENLKKVGVLSQLNIKPLLLSMKEYLESDDSNFVKGFPPTFFRKDYLTVLIKQLMRLMKNIGNMLKNLLLLKASILMNKLKKK
jgi:hypothetical protein